MKQNIIPILWGTALLLAACAQEEPHMPVADNATPLAISITDGGYGASAGGDPGQQPPQSRAEENKYTTAFTAGDACGLYMVHGGTVVYENIKLTAATGTDGNTIIWQPETPIAGGLADEQYFLYYPYQSDMDGKINASATGADDFFAPLISGWQPKADQSTYAAYTASDLMISKGTTAGETDGMVSVSFSMAHQMALAVVEMPKKIYHFINDTGGPIPDYIEAEEADFTESGIKPFEVSPGTFRSIVNPGNSVNMNIFGLYDGGKEFSVTPSGIAAGKYKVYDIDRRGAIEYKYRLQAGDFYCSKEIDGKTIGYVVPQQAVNDLHKNRCIGIVFHAGQHANDDSDYTATGIGQQECRGYVVALTDALNDDDGKCNWVDNGFKVPRVGTAAKEPDAWEGFSNQQRIRKYADDRKDEGWRFPAALACESYCNRTHDKDGNPTTAFDWQKPLSAPDNTSGWFLPAIGQLLHIYDNRELLSAQIADAKNNAPVDSKYKDYIRWFNTDTYYWTSSESWYFGGSSVWTVRFSEGRHPENLLPDCNYFRVRSVLAF